MQEFFEKNPDKRPPRGSSTALSRGYVATFKIENGRLCVFCIEVPVYDSREEYTYYKDITFDIFDTDDLMMDWYTGVMEAPYGEAIGLPFVGYGADFSKTMLFGIDSGRLVDVRDYTHEEYKAFRERQFAAFQKTEQYAALREDRTRTGLDMEMIDGFIKERPFSYMSKILVE